MNGYWKDGYWHGSLSHGYPESYFDANTGAFHFPWEHGYEHFAVSEESEENENVNEESVVA